MHRLLLVAAVASALAGCGDRLSQIGRTPELTPIQSPLLQPEIAAVAMPVPDPGPPAMAGNGSLWRGTGTKAFFRDQRAQRVGDILTVLIDIQDQARLRNETRRSRDAQEDMGLDGLFGLEGSSPLLGETPVGLDSSSSSTGAGSVNRNETISLRVAAVVTQVLPNGNLVIAGRQEVRVNYELRELRVAGVIRPQDVTNLNTIDASKIAEARIVYGGRGQITDVQQPRYGQQFLDIILPW